MQRTHGIPAPICVPGLDQTTAEVLRSAVHDLKGPTSRLCVLAGLLQRSGAGLDDDAKALLRHVTDSADALNVVVEGLRNYTELCSRELQLETVDLATLLTAAIAGLEPGNPAIGSRDFL